MAYSYCLEASYISQARTPRPSMAPATPEFFITLPVRLAVDLAPVANKPAVALAADKAPALTLLPRLLMRLVDLEAWTCLTLVTVDAPAAFLAFTAASCALALSATESLLCAFQLWYRSTIMPLAAAPRAYLASSSCGTMPPKMTEMTSSTVVKAVWISPSTVRRCWARLIR